MSELTSGDRGRRVATLITSRVGSIVILLATLVVTALAFATVPDQPAAGPTDGLPAGKQSTRVTELADRFPSGRTTSAIVVYERAAGPLTAADRAAITAASSTLATEALGGRLAPPVPSQDGRAELLVVPLDGSTSSEDASAVVDEIRRQVHPTGSAALPRGSPPG